MSGLPPTPPQNALTVIGASGSALTLAGSPSGQDVAYDVTLTANCVLTLAGSNTGRLQAINVVLRQNATAGWTPSFPLATWSYGSTPSFNTKAGVVDLVQFLSVDGVNWYYNPLTPSAVGAGMTLAPISSATAGASQTIYGSYTGAAPTNIDYNLNGAGWTTLGSGVATISNGAITFPLTMPAAGSGNTLQIRNTGAPTEVSSAITFTTTASGAASLTHYLSVPSGSTGGGAYANSATSNDSTNGVVDTRFWGKLTSWQAPSSSSNAFLNSKYQSSVSSGGSTKSNSEWSFSLGSDGTPNFSYYDTSGTFHNYYASPTQAGSGTPATSVVTPDATRGMWLRAVANLSSSVYTDPEGATHAKNTVTFYASLDNGQGVPSNWQILGVAQTGATAALNNIGAACAGYGVAGLYGVAGITGSVFRSYTYDAGATAGTNRVLVNVDFTAQSSSTSTSNSGDTPTFADTAPTPNTFTVYGPQYVV